MRSLEDLEKIAESLVGKPAKDAFTEVHSHNFRMAFAIAEIVHFTDNTDAIEILVREGKVHAAKALTHRANCRE